MDTRFNWYDKRQRNVFPAKRVCEECHSRKAGVASRKLSFPRKRESSIKKVYGYTFTPV